MADSVATRVARHRAKKRKGGVTRLTVELDRATVTVLRRLAKHHDQTQGQIIKAGVLAADRLLAGRLVVAGQPAVVSNASPAPKQQTLARTKAVEPPAPNQEEPRQEAQKLPLEQPTASPVDAALTPDQRIRAAAVHSWEAP